MIIFNIKMLKDIWNPEQSYPEKYRGNFVTDENGHSYYIYKNGREQQFILAEMFDSLSLILKHESN